MHRSWFTIAVLVVAMAWMFGCGEGGGAPVDSSDPTGPEDPVPTRVSLSADEVTLKDGESIDLTATVYDQNDRPMGGAELTWSSDNPDIATVEDGTITAQHPGTTEITATAGQASATAVVTVEPVPAKLVKVSSDGQIALVSNLLPESLVVRVVDRHGNGVPGVIVEFRFVPGTVMAGSIHPSSVATDAEGYAATTWTVGPVPGEQMVDASVDGLEGSPVLFTATGRWKDPVPIAIGDTVQGVISEMYQVDRYSFTGTTGQEIITFFQPLSGSDTLNLTLEMQSESPNPIVLGSAHRVPPTDDLQDAHVLLLTLPADGTFLIVVSPFHAGHRGAYRFQVFPIDRRPETASAEIAIGDTIEGEAVGPKGDIDEFTFTATAGQEIEIWFEASGGSDTLVLIVYEHYGTPDEKILEWIEAPAASEMPDAQARRISLPADGTYTIVVRGNDVDDFGSYRLAMLPYSP